MDKNTLKTVLKIHIILKKLKCVRLKKENIDNIRYTAKYITHTYTIMATFTSQRPNSSKHISN